VSGAQKGPQASGLEGVGAGNTEHSHSSDPSVACPRYARCAVNRCPLSPSYDKQKSHPDDAEQKCRLWKSKRMEVAARHPGVLRREGMTAAEFSASSRPLPENFRRQIGRGFSQETKILENTPGDSEARPENGT
jgi:hypothetical protein